MTAIKRDLVIEQGATYQKHYTLSDVDKDPIDLVSQGYGVRMTIRRDFQLPTALVELSTDNGKITLHDGSVEGRFTTNITPTDTDVLDIRGSAMDAVYDIELVLPNGNVTRLYYGDITINKNVTT